MTSASKAAVNSNPHLTGAESAKSVSSSERAENNTAMHALFVVNKYFPFGGMQRSLLRIAQALIARGHRVTVLTRSWEGERPQHLQVLEQPLNSLTNHGRNLELARRLEDAKRQLNPDVVVGFTKMPGLDVYYAGDPCLAEKLRRSKSRWVLKLPRYQKLLALEEAVFGAEQHTEILLFAHQEEAHFARHYHTAPERFHRLPPGINRERLDGYTATPEDLAKLRDELGLSVEEKILLHIGSGFRTKGVDRLIEGFAALPQPLRDSTQLLIVGKDKSAAFERLAQRLDVASRVHFLGPREDVVRFYHLADGLAHPAYAENTGTTLIESMYCGLPVLASGVCGFAHHIEAAQAGLVTPEPFAQPVFNQQLRQLLESDERARWSENGVRYCQQQDLYSLIERAADVIEQKAFAKTPMSDLNNNSNQAKL